MKREPDYKNMTQEQLAIIHEYCKDELKELKKVCHIVWGKNGISDSDHDDLYDDAINVLSESVVTFDNSKGTKFRTYLANNIRMSFGEWFRDRYLRAKRNNLELDENGNIKRDEKGNPFIINNLSFDSNKEDETDLKEIIASDFSVENECNLDFEGNENVETFLNGISKIQRKILELRMNGYSVAETKEKLKLSDREFSNEMKSIKQNNNLSLFSKNRNDVAYININDNTEVDEMEDRIIEISESDNYRMDKRSLYSLLEDKRTGEMNCKYILQREPFQWTTEEANRYFCRVLSNLPIPEIILCEQNKKGMTISHLIDGLQRLSYAEAFKENRMKITASGAERHLIQYREFELDENGNRVLDEDGVPIFELKVFDVIGKYYKDLPDFLKKRFNEFNINVTKFFNCTDEQIADHIRDYNNHASMNKEQGGMTKISAMTASLIKDISKKNTFFKNCKKFTDNDQIKGKVDRVIAESMMLLFFRDSWKSNLEDIYKYIDEHATNEQFLKLNSNFNRLELALGDDNSEIRTMFTKTTMPMWIAVFDKFITYDMDDKHFIDFLKAYNTDLKDREIDGVSMADFKDQQTKKKTTITGKIDLLIKLMEEYLHIDKTEVVVEKSKETVESSPLLGFVKKNADPEATDEDIELYEDMVNSCVDNNEVRVDSPVYQKCKDALVALMAYACQKNKDRDFEEWFTEYTNETKFASYAKANYTYMKNSFDQFLQNQKSA